MGGATWSGTYLRSPIEAVATSLLRLSQSRNFVLLANLRQVSQENISHNSFTQLFGPGGRHEFIALLELDNGWTRLVGLELVNSSYPRLFFGSELITNLGCDAFECGYYDRQGWWYSYYEEGRVVDRFHSNPDEPLELYAADIQDPNDLRTVYIKCLRYSFNNTAPVFTSEISLPTAITRKLVGHPEILAPIARNGDTSNIPEILLEEDVEIAVERLARQLSLPYLGEIQIEDIVQAHPYHPSYPLILTLIKRGLTLIVLEHPKVHLL
jgi:hypothetical protein